MKFKMTFSDGEGKTITCEAGRASLWKANDAEALFPDNAIRNQRVDYAWGFYAAQSAGILPELGIDDPETDVQAGIDVIADRWDLAIEKAWGDETGEAKGKDPLEATPGKSL